MKVSKSIMCIIGIFLMTLPLCAKDSYYYYKGNKIPLQLSEDSVNVYTIRHEVIRGKLHSIYTSQLSSIENLKEHNDSVSSIEYLIKGDKEYTVKMSNRFYVQLYDSINDFQRLQHVAEETNSFIFGRIPYMPDWYEMIVHNSTFNNSLELSNYFYETGLFKAVDPGFIFNFSPSTACVTDTYFESHQWGMDAINACDAWNITKGNSNVHIAVIDDGIQRAHDEFSYSQFNYEYDCDTHSPDNYHIYDEHGTLVCGIISANHNYARIAGVAPICKIIPIAYSSSNRDSVAVNIASGISWAVAHNASVINCSWGDHLTYEYLHSETLESAIQSALVNGRGGKGCVVVFSAGNQGVNQLDYPASFFADILTVGAIKNDNTKRADSSYGVDIDIMGPGDNIYTLGIWNNYVYASGTSVAAPHVSGIAGLILSINPDLTQKQVADILESTAQKVGNYSYTIHAGRGNGTWNDSVGYGLVDAYAAVQKAADMHLKGPDILQDSAWYYIANLPANTSVTWSITNELGTLKQYTIVSQTTNGDSVYIANRQNNGSNPPPIFPGLLNGGADEINAGLYHKGYITATLSNGATSYALHKTIREPNPQPWNPSFSFALSGNVSHSQINIIISKKDSLQQEQIVLDDNKEYTLELWHSIYGKMMTQQVHNTQEQMNITGLPIGVYVLILKENGNIVAETKVFV